MLGDWQRLLDLKSDIPAVDVLLLVLQAGLPTLVPGRDRVYRVILYSFIRLLLVRVVPGVGVGLSGVLGPLLVVVGVIFIFVVVCISFLLRGWLVWALTRLLACRVATIVAGSGEWDLGLVLDLPFAGYRSCVRALSSSIRALVKV